MGSGPVKGFNSPEVNFRIIHHSKFDCSCYPARALRALGLLLADGAPTVGRGKTF